MLEKTRRRLKIIQKKKWIEHIMRKESLVKVLLEERMKGKSSKGKPRQMSLDKSITSDNKSIKRRAMRR